MQKVRLYIKKLRNIFLDKYNFKVSSLNIAQVKDKCGIKERDNYNKPKRKIVNNQVVNYK